jgi:hypothetical protein
MTTLDPQLTTLFAVTIGIGYLMIQSGLQKSMLEWKRRRRACPSCGRELSVCACKTR